MTPHSSNAVPVAARVAGFTYAIRNIVNEARKVEATGTRIRYLNIGDPIIFGFKTPPHLIEAVERAMRDNQNCYAPSPGIPSAREAVAADFTARGVPTVPDRVLITTGASEGIDLALNALANPGDEVLVPMPTYPLYTAVLAKIAARAVFYRLDPANRWQPDLDGIRRLVTPKTRALVVIDPNNPTGSVYPPETRRALLDLAARHGFVLLADEVYGDLAYDGPVPPMAALDLDAPVISFSSLSKAYLAPGWRAGWMAVGRSARLDDVVAALRKLADGRLCSPVPMQYAVTAALTQDRAHQVTLRADLRAPRLPRGAFRRCPACRASRRLRRSMPCRASSCRRAGPTRSSSSVSCAPRAYCASMVRASACRRTPGSSAWCSWRRLPSSTRSTTPSRASPSGF